MPYHTTPHQCKQTAPSTPPFPGKAFISKKQAYTKYWRYPTLWSSKPAGDANTITPSPPLPSPHLPYSISSPSPSSCVNCVSCVNGGGPTKLSFIKLSGSNWLSVKGFPSHAAKLYLPCAPRVIAAVSRSGDEEGKNEIGGRGKGGGGVWGLLVFVFVFLLFCLFFCLFFDDDDDDKSGGRFAWSEEEEGCVSRGWVWVRGDGWVMSTVVAWEEGMGSGGRVGEVEVLKSWA